MITVDWTALLTGLLAGLLMSVLFFTGLAWGMRLALRSVRPGGILLLSAFCRIALLLGVGFWLAAITANVWVPVGYGLAFLLTRLAVVFRARIASVAPKQGGI